MDSYFFGWYLGRPASPPLPDEHSGGYLPQMPPYSGASQSQNTSVPQPIDFGGSASGYSSASQSRRTSVPPIEYGSSSRSGRTTGSGSRASQRTYRDYPDEVKSRALSEMQQEVASGGTIKSYASRSTIPYATLTSWYSKISGSRPGHHCASDEEKASRLRELEQELDNKTSTIAEFCRKTGIPRRTLTRWRQEARSRNS